MRRRVVITGLCVVAPNGIGKEEFWRANVEGKSGVSLIEDFDTSKLNSKVSGRIKNFDPLDYISKEITRRSDRFVHLGMAAARMAVENSRLNIEKEHKENVGVYIGSVFGGVLFHEEQIMAGYERGAHRLNPLCVPRITSNAVSSHISIEFKITGPNLVASAACSSGTHAIGQAFRMIQNNEVDVMLAGGVEAPLTVFTFGAFCAMHVLSKRADSPQEASRPFDKGRDGFVLGEGGAVLVLEDLSHAVRRDAYIYAEIIGYSSNSGAYHMVMPDPQGRDAAQVVVSALKDARIKSQEVDYINAYGTSSPLNDKIETQVIKDVFKEHAYNVPISSTKSMIGHTMGASGAIEAVACALSIKNNVIPPTINYACPDPECDLDYVPNRARKSRVNTVLSTSFGMGNNNAAIILRDILLR